MCGRFFVDLTEEQLVGLYHFQVSAAALASSDLAPRYNIAPTHDIIACRRDASAGYELAPLRWGLIPHWARPGHNPYTTFNARSETASEKPTFRDAFRSRRCLVPASGFYEWKPGPSKKGVPKQPYRIRRLDEDGQHEPMIFAGLWSTWRDPDHPDAPAIESVAVLTRPAEGPIAEVHHRMPVMLSGDLHQPWMDDRAPEEHTALLLDAPTPELEVVPVSTRVNAVANNDPELLQPVEPAENLPEPPARPSNKKQGPDEGPSLFDAM